MSAIITVSSRGLRLRLALRALAASVLMLSLMGARCANACIDLDERVCDDLGASDCEVWRSHAQISRGILPGDDYYSQRANTAIPICRMYGAAENYQTYTLPLIRWRITQLREPGSQIRPPSPDLLHPPGDPLGMPSWLYYLIGPLALIGMLGYHWFYRRRLLAKPPVVQTWKPPGER